MGFRSLLQTSCRAGLLAACVGSAGCASELVPRVEAICDGASDCLDADVEALLDASVDAAIGDDAGASPDGGERGDAGNETADAAVVDAELGDAALADASDAAAPDGGSSDAGPPDAGPPACTWSPYGEGITGGQVNWAAFDPAEPGRIWATTPTQVLRTTAGATWAETGRPGSSVTSLALPRDGLPLIGASSDGLRRSDDDGVTWRAGALGGLSITSVVRSPADPRVLFATTSGGGFFISSDGGTGWRSAGFGLSPSAVLAVAPDPRGGRDVVAGGPYLNATGGWSDTGFLARSSDGGVTYAVVFTETGRTQALARCPGDPDVLISAHVYGMARSRDGGRTFTRIAPTVFGNTGAVALAGAACEVVYATRIGQGVMRSRDGGDTWEGPLREGMTLVPGQTPRGLSVDPADPRHVVASSSGGLFETFDGGDRWTPVPGIGIPVLRAVRASEAEPATLWLATWGLGVWMRPPGDVWRFVSGVPRDLVNSVREDAEGRVFSMGYRSPDRVAFTNPGPMGNVFDVATDPGAPDVVWAVTQTLGIWRSSNGGVTFTQANGGLAPWVTPVGTFVDARSVLMTSGAVLVGTQGRGVARSTDDGASFALDPSGDGRRISCLESLGDAGVVACVSAADPGFLLSRDAGLTWSPWNDGLASLDVAGIVRDPRTGSVYATTSEGVYVRGVDRWEPVEPGCLQPGLGAPTVQRDGDGRSYLVVPAPEALLVRRPI